MTDFTPTLEMLDRADKNVDPYSSQFFHLFNARSIITKGVKVVDGNAFERESLYHCLSLPKPGRFIEDVYNYGFNPEGTFFASEENSLAFFERHKEYIIYKRAVGALAKLDDPAKIYLARLSFEYWTLNRYLVTFTTWKDLQCTPGEKYNGGKDYRSLFVNRI